jgi:hypothetical protein
MKPLPAETFGALKIFAALLPQGLLRMLAFHSTVIFFILLVLLVSGVFIWAAFFRKPARHRSTRHRSRPKEEVAIQNGAAAPATQPVKRRHKRRRQRQPLNPTLAQTRGLPPVRDKQSTPPPSY